MKSKIYTLEVEYLVDLDGGGITCYYSKGHHDANDFINEALKEHEVIIQPDEVKQGYMRHEFYGDDTRHAANIYKTPGRGKFPVTYTYEWVPE